MLDTIPHFLLLACVEPAIVAGQIAGDATKLGDVFTAALRARVIKLRGIAAVVAGIDGEIDGKVGNVEALQGVVDDAFDGFGVLHHGRIALDISDGAAGAESGERSFQPELVIDGNLLPHGNVEGVGQVVAAGDVFDGAILPLQVCHGGAAQVFCHWSLAFAKG